jgi:hypothetical protein
MGSMREVLFALRGVTGILVPVTQKLTDSTGASQRSNALKTHTAYILSVGGAAGVLGAHIKLGNSSVSAATTDWYLPANAKYLVIFTGDNAYLAMIREGSISTDLYISEFAPDAEASNAPKAGQFGT